MTYRKVRSHSDEWWLTMSPPHVVRCQGTYKSTGEQCRRVAEDGAVVCDQHGGAAGQVRRRAAERIAFTADDAAQRLVEWMNDPKVDMRERVKIAHDMLDRGGLAAAQVHKIMPIVEDPVEALFKSILEDPNGTYDVAAVEASRTLEAARAREMVDLIGTLPDADIVDAEIVEDDYDDGVVVPIFRQTSDRPPRKRNPMIPPKHIREGLDLI